MTLLEDTLTQVRETHPDLELEVRSVLLARAQEGATISEIRDDYRKAVGTNFPIYEHIPEFLLSIPNVSAYCSERGTLIFRILPTPQTQHLYDMVMEQKPAQAARNWRPDPPSYHASVTQLQSAKPYWRGNRRKIEPSLPPPTYHPQSTQNRNRSGFGSLIGGEHYPLSKSNPKMGQTHHHEESNREGCKDINYYYQDNCNYLYSRLYSKHKVLPQIVPATDLGSADHWPKECNSNGHNVRVTIEPRNSLNNKLQYHPPQQNQHRSNSQHSWLQLKELNIHGENPLKRQRYTYSRSSDTNISTSYASSELDYDAHLLDFPLLGDDFFLYLARMELQCKFKTAGRVYQSGLCVSGQTIRAAIRRLRDLRPHNKRIIVNIGSVDIMQGRRLLQIEHDFRKLIILMQEEDITPILTTLAPLANYAHVPQVKEHLERFNAFIQREAHRTGCQVIDIHACLVNEKNQILFDCYQHGPRSVTGADESYVFWNKIGRQRVLQQIESEIEY